jgi:dienelactone hydrolase
MPQEIVLFHSALGLRPSILDWAAFLRAAGHRVHAPDVFDGEVFSTVQEGLRKRDALGIPEIIKRTRAVIAPLPEGLVYMGCSLGAAAAELLATARPGAKGAILLHAALPVGAVGASAWPVGVPVQIHYAKDDPWATGTNIKSLEDSVAAAGAPAEVYCYEGGIPHMFDDTGLAGYSSEATALMRARVTGFLDRL